MSLVPQTMNSVNFQMSGAMQPVAQNQNQVQLQNHGRQTGPYHSSTIYNEFTQNKNDQKYCRNKGTQTVGLFYPGGKRMHQENQKQLEEEFNKLKNKSIDNMKFVSNVSPGQGYWRKQIDHVNGHVRQYASENLEFRSLIADQKFGKILHSHINEETDKVTLSFTFELHGFNQKSLRKSTANYKDKKLAFGSKLERNLDENDYSLSKEKREKEKYRQRKSRSIEKQNSVTFQRGRSPTRKEQEPVDRLLIKELKKPGDNET